MRAPSQSWRQASEMDSIPLALMSKPRPTKSDLKSYTTQRNLMWKFYPDLWTQERDGEIKKMMLNEREREKLILYQSFLVLDVKLLTLSSHCIDNS